MQIDFSEKYFLNPLNRVERKTGRVILTQKDRRTLQRIYGIIETNALYLTGNTSKVAGKFNLRKVSRLEVVSLEL